MLTQIKPAKNVADENIITLEIHPTVRQKIRVNKRLPKRAEFKPKISEEKGILFKQQQQHGFESIENSSPQSFRKTESFTPANERKNLRPPRLSSYQLYKEEQKEIKTMHKDKINDWKMKVWSKRSEDKSRGQSRQFSRSKSYVEHGTIKPKDSIIDTINTHKLSTISKTVEDSPRSRSLYIKTNEGKKRMIDNRKYLQRLKICLEINPLSTCYNSFFQARNLQPQVLALSPKNKEKPMCRKGSCNAKQELMKYRQQRKGKNRFDLNDNFCRPWSGHKGEHVQELPIFLQDN